MFTCKLPELTEFEAGARRFQDSNSQYPPGVPQLRARPLAKAHCDSDIFSSLLDSETSVFRGGKEAPTSVAQVLFRTGDVGHGAERRGLH